MAIQPGLVLICASLLAAACAPLASTADGGPGMSDTRPGSDRGCRMATEPRALPSADAMVDSAALTQQVARLWREAGGPAGHVVLAMRYDEQGRNVRRDVLEYRVAEQMADSVQKLVFAARRTTAPAEAEWGVRMRVDVGAEPALRVTRSRECRPAPLERSDGALAGTFSNWGDVRDSAPPPTMGDGGLVWVRVALSASGHVTDVRVERSATRIPEHRLLQYVRMIAFNPATVDGYPVAGETSIPLRVR
ncbi:MAG TPA: energy transducer TonB [Longimicrobium sp.]|jgi:TonB family protein|uniref:energy transducer TonB family protein n=1 Tax=Longimicrobium sp. TaxID=2029185 RepID=UPI002EDA5175